MNMHCRKPLIIGITAVVTIVGPPALALCPNGPMNALVVNNDPVLLQQCEPGGGNCTVPAKPTIDLVSPHNGPQSQEVVAVIPTGMSGVTSVAWTVEYVQPTTGLIGVLYSGEFLDGFETPRNGGDTIRTVVPGLLADTEHYYKVAFCVEDDCTCWSDRSDQIADPAERNTAPFSTSWPAHPAGIDLEVEDTFNRAETQPKYDPQSPSTRLGDGLGPWGLSPSALNLRGIVWQDGLEGISAGNGSHISSDDSRAFLPVNAAPCYTREATNQHIFFESVFELDPVAPDDTYNFDLRGRLHFDSAMQLQGYYVKLADGWVGAEDPTLRIGRAVGMNLSTGAEITIPDASQPKCDEEPPLKTTNGETVWLRGEIIDAGDPLRPKIIATAAWGNCPSGQDLAQCDHVCTTDYTDTGGIDFLGVEGMWGIFAHERNYYVDLFRAGSAPSP